MFKINNGHLQEKLFSDYSTMNPKILERLKKTWSPIFYEHVFCRIDEAPFAPLYCPDNGRPNFPINILLSLEFLKHLRDYTDEEIIEQFYFNYQVIYALGLLNLGELYLAPRTLYEFRERLYRYTVEHPGQDDLIFGQFEQLTAHFLEVANIDAKEQRMDSTQVLPNIKRAGRLALAYDVLVQAIKACPPEILTAELKRVPEPDYKRQALYRLRGSQTASRLQELLDLCAELLAITSLRPAIHQLDPVRLAQRFLEEQATFNPESRKWLAKENKEIAANSLQSAYEPDATYRKKGNEGYSGYVLNLAETCADANPVQLISDYTLEKNITSDGQMLEERLPVLQEKTELTDLYTDGGYYSPEVAEKAPDSGITLHYTDMTGKKPASGKIPWTQFTIDSCEIIIACPADQAPLSTNFKKESGLLTARFDLTTCQACPLQESCPVKFQKTSAVVRVKKNAILAAGVRNRLLAERREATSKRAAIEGTNSALKRSQGAGRLRVRGQTKCQLVIGCKVIAHNVQQIFRFFCGDVRRRMEKLTKSTDQGVLAPI